MASSGGSVNVMSVSRSNRLNQGAAVFYEKIRGSVQRP
jgi:hypothetical protein